MLYFRDIADESDHSADYQSISHQVPSLMWVKTFKKYGIIIY